jgi:hypothetical protein
MKSDINKSISNIAKYVNDNVNALNDSKLFAGLMIITLNIASKFVTIKLSKTMESYLKYTFSKQILVFVIAWMGSRNIYIAVIITVIFIICIDYLFNEDSQFCCLPYTFTKYHIDRLENYENLDGETISDEDIKKAELILEKAKKQLKPTIQDTQKSGYTNY